MSPEFLQKLVDLFDNSLERYNTFQILRKHEDQIHNEWKGRLSRRLQKVFIIDAPKDSQWNMKFWGHPFDTTWYLKKFGEYSVSIQMINERIVFWVGPQFCTNVNDAKELIVREKFQPLIFKGLELTTCTGNSAFNDGVRGQWKFGSPLDYKFESRDQLLWFAGNRTNEYVDQIAQKVNRIREDDELTSLLWDLNEDLEKRKENALAANPSTVEKQ